MSHAGNGLDSFFLCSSLPQLPGETFNSFRLFGQLSPYRSAFDGQHTRHSIRYAKPTSMHPKALSRESPSHSLAFKCWCAYEKSLAISPPSVEELTMMLLMLV